MHLLETSGETKIGQLDVAAPVEQNVVWLDISVLGQPRLAEETADEPVDEAKLVDRFYRQHALRNVESRHVLGEGVVFDQHRHQVTAGQKFHDQVKVRGILE